MTTDGGRLGAETYTALAADWSPAQIVEIVAVIGLFNYFNRFANALQIPPTK
jgi:alkylhydroperoxidase family enzyme